MDARFASRVFLALGFADLAVLNLILGPRLIARDEAPVAAAPRPDPPAAPAQAAPAPPAAVDGAEKKHAPQQDLAVPDVHFAIASDRVTGAEADLSLQRAARALRDDPARRLLVRGHSDRLGAPRLNLALSRRRAEAVRRVLVAHGAPADRVDVEAVGGAEPKDRADTPAAWAQNRRVQVLFR